MKFRNCGASILPPMMSTNSVVSFMSGSKARLPPGELSKMKPKSGIAQIRKSFENVFEATSVNMFSVLMPD
jgi:hypothetical protein